MPHGTINKNIQFQKESCFEKIYLLSIDQLNNILVFRAFLKFLVSNSVEKYLTDFIQQEANKD